MGKIVVQNTESDKKRDAVVVTTNDDTYSIIEDTAPGDSSKKMAIFGSRSLFDCRVGVVINEVLNEYRSIETIVTTQEPKGVCEIAQATAKANNLILELHFLNFRRAKGAFEHRSKNVIAASDYVLIIHDGVSAGTANELEYTRRSKKPFRYVVMPASSVYVDRDEGVNFLKTTKHLQNGTE